MGKFRRLNNLRLDPTSTASVATLSIGHSHTLIRSLAQLRVPWGSQFCAYWSWYGDRNRSRISVRSSRACFSEYLLASGPTGPDPPVLEASSVVDEKSTLCPSAQRLDRRNGVFASRKTVTTSPEAMYSMQSTANGMGVNEGQGTLNPALLNSGMLSQSSQEPRDVLEPQFHRSLVSAMSLSSNLVIKMHCCNQR